MFDAPRFGAESSWFSTVLTKPFEVQSCTDVTYRYDAGIERLQILETRQFVFCYCLAKTPLPGELRFYRNVGFLSEWLHSTSAAHRRLMKEIFCNIFTTASSHSNFIMSLCPYASCKT